MMKRLLTLALAALALPAMAQTVYRCPGTDGQPLFQQVPCAGGKAIDATPANIIEANRAEVERARRVDAVRTALARGTVITGMTAAEMQQVMGNPVAVNRDVFGGERSTQYVFRYDDGSTHYIYTRDDAVIGGQIRSGRRR